jgi:hypothetical protein
MSNVASAHLPDQNSSGGRHLRDFVLLCAGMPKYPAHPLKPTATLVLGSKPLELNSESQLADERWSADTSAEAVKAEWLRLLPGVAGLGLAGGGEDESDEDAESLLSARQLSQGECWCQGVNAVEVFKKVQELGIEKKREAVTGPRVLLRHAHTSP